jgi:RNA polymerase sigma-70 factor (ECF subfamily)
MSQSPRVVIRQQIDEIYRAQSRRIFATLIRLLGDFDLAEEALHDAFAAAIEQWPRGGLPANPGAWLVSAGRYRAIDAGRRRDRFDASIQELAARSFAATDGTGAKEVDEIHDDQLRLIFTCCHPALSAPVQVALTLREVCGLTTEQIASAFLVPPTSIAQRIVRGKAKIRDAHIPYVMPTIADLPDRIESVLSVVYLVFTEGYAASSGDSLMRPDLSAEAIRLARLLVELLPDGEVIGLLALVLLQDSRRQARTSIEGEIILLEDQDRRLWNRAQITEGAALVERAMASQSIGLYTIQAAIASVHAQALSTSATDWSRIVDLYDLLLTASPSPIVELNRAVAVAMRDGPLAGLNLIDAIFERGELLDYHLAHAARADFRRRLGRKADARGAYERAIALCKQEPERHFLEKRLGALS